MNYRPKHLMLVALKSKVPTPFEPKHNLEGKAARSRNYRLKPGGRPGPRTEFERAEIQQVFIESTLGVAPRFSNLLEPAKLIRLRRQGWRQGLHSRRWQALQKRDNPVCINFFAIFLTTVKADDRGPAGVHYQLENRVLAQQRLLLRAHQKKILLPSGPAKLLTKKRIPAGCLRPVIAHAVGQNHRIPTCPMQLLRRAHNHRRVTMRSLRMAGPR